MRHSLVTALLVVLGLTMVASAVLYAAEPELTDATLTAPQADADPTPTPAPAPLPTPDNLGEYMGALWTAASAGAWVGLMALLVNGLMWYLRRKQGWFVQQWAWLGTKGGGLALLFVFGALAEVLARLASPAGTVPLGFMAVLVGAVAAGFNAMSKAAPALARSTWRAVGGR